MKSPSLQAAWESKLFVPDRTEGGKRQWEGAGKMKMGKQQHHHQHQPYVIFACVIFLISIQIELIGGTDCYVCYSWKDNGCEEDWIENVNLTTCGTPSTHSTYWRGIGNLDREREERDRVLNAPPFTCVKDVITFINPPIRSQNDRYNRFNRPWVERKCGISIQASYRSGLDYEDICSETEVTIEGVQGIKRSCTCSTDGCNTASPLLGTNIVLISAVTTAALFAKLVAVAY